MSSSPFPYGGFHQDAVESQIEDEDDDDKEQSDDNHEYQHDPSDNGSQGSLSLHKQKARCPGIFRNIMRRNLSQIMLVAPNPHHPILPCLTTDKYENCAKSPSVQR